MKELEARRSMPALVVCEQLEFMADSGLFHDEEVQELSVSDVVSAQESENSKTNFTEVPAVSFSPQPKMK